MAQLEATCHSPTAGYQGVYDLTGNVSEWEDSCEGVGQSPTCWLRGGNFNGVACGNFGECASGCRPTRLDADEITGFRCCS